MANTKKQLFTAIAMLLIATMALGTSTYAWFVANKVATVETMNFTAETADILQVALTTDAWDGKIAGTGMTAPTEGTAFKSLISNADITTLYTAKAATFTSALNPASTINLTNFFVADAAGWNNEGTELSRFKETTYVSESAVKVIPLYFKANKDAKLVFDKSSTVTGDAAAAARVGIVQNGSIKLLWAPVASTTHIENSGNTTNASGNADGITKAVNTTSTVANITTTVDQAVTLATNKEIGDLTANTAMPVLVYVWLEGCDEDCVSYLSEKDLAVNLKFTIEDDE